MASSKQFSLGRVNFHVSGALGPAEADCCIGFRILGLRWSSPPGQSETPHYVGTPSSPPPTAPTATAAPSSGIGLYRWPYSGDGHSWTSLGWLGGHMYPACMQDMSLY